MPNVSQKENHFVPKTLLKSWATKEEKELYVYTLNLKDNLLRKQPTSSLAKKKNLYTLPSEFSTDNPKIVEHLIFKTWEDNRSYSACSQQQKMPNQRVGSRAPYFKKLKLRSNVLQVYSHKYSHLYLFLIKYVFQLIFNYNGKYL